MAENIGRREFVKLGLAGLATTAVGLGMARAGQTIPLSKVVASPGDGHDEASSTGPRWAMVIDQSKCVGCEHCLDACRAYNDIAPDNEWCRMETQVSEEGDAIFRPVACQHCQDAPCVEICPVGASYRRDDGIIMMDYDRCIGCRYCQLACPFGARTFNWESFTGDNPNVPTYGQPEVARRPRGVVEKCAFCYHRIDRGLAMGLTPGKDAAATPACVVACTHGARLFGDLNDPNSSVSQALANHPSYRLREDLGLETRVYYLPAEGQEEEVS